MWNFSYNQCYEEKAYCVLTIDERYPALLCEVREEFLEEVTFELKYE